jgi:hypothetical protein
MNEVPLEQLSRERFAELIGSEFLVEAEGGKKVGLKLTTVSQARISGPGGPGTRYESFSLFLDGPCDLPLAQRTYVVEHPQIGTFSLFIVPVANERGCLQYQVVFNRLCKEV